MSKNSVKISIVGDASKLKQAFGVADKTMGGFAKGAGIAGAAVATAAVAGGAALLKMGTDLDKAYDSIVVATGATGPALDGLKDDFREVFANVPTDSASAATAIGELNTRLGLTGKPLQDVSKQMLELTRLTGGDIGTNAANITRLFGDWGVAAEDQAGMMDRLFKATQVTGIGLDELTTTVVSYGAPMRQMGFSIDEATALLGKFHLEGVNTEAILAGMKAGLGKMAKAGEEPIDTFARVTESIKAAGTQGEANAIALEAFGSRAGPDMAAAIREGRFELDEMVAAMGDSDGAIAGAAKQTESWTEKWQMFKNRALLKIEPIAMRVFDGMGVAMDKLGPPLEKIGSGIAALFSGDAAGAGVDIGAALGFAEDSNATDMIIGGLETITGMVGDTIGFVKSNLPTVRKVWTEVAGTVLDTARAAFPAVRDTVTSVFMAIMGAWQSWGAPTFAILQTVFQQASSFFAANGPGMIADVQNIAAQIAPILQGLGEFIATVLEVIAALWGEWGDEVFAIVGIAWDLIAGVIQAGMSIIKGVIDVVMGLIQGDWSRVWGGIVSIFSGIWTLIKTIVGKGGQILKEGFTAALGLAKLAVIAGIDFIVGLFDGLPGKLMVALIAIGGAAKAVGQGIWDGIVSGLRAATGFIGDVASSIWGGIKNFLNDKLIDPIRGFEVGILGKNIKPFGSLPRLAQGGITNGETVAVIGDNPGGRELVAPLPRGFEISDLVGAGGQPQMIVYLDVSTIDPQTAVQYLQKLLERMARDGNTTFRATGNSLP